MASFVFLLASPMASAQVWSDCAVGDGPGAPPPSCNNICGIAAGGDLVCTLQSCAGDSNITLVESWGSSTNDFSAYGDCNGTSFCCTYTDTTFSTGKIFVAGSDHDDTISLTDGSDRLEPHSASFLKVFVRAYGGADTITGSDYESCITAANDYTECGALPGYAVDDYEEHLFGGNGNDNIVGKHGCDYLYGNAGADYLHGNNGHDCLYGNRGVDYMIGGSHCDYIEDECDSGAGGQQQHVEGGPHDDDILITWDATCSTGDVLDATSTCDQGTPAGTSDDFGVTNAIQTLPADCENAAASFPDHWCDPLPIPTIPTFDPPPGD